MKRDSYSVYETKARLSEILRKVRRNRRVTITHAGVAVAEIVPVYGEPETFEERLDRLEEEGVVTPAAGDCSTLKPYGKRPGALKRFLRERRRDE